MNAIETVRATLAAIEAQDWETARGYLTDDFTFSGAVPQPISAEAWLGVHRALGAAMPDFSFNVSGLREEQGVVSGTVQLTGTQTRELKLPIPGTPAIAPTGRHLSMAAENFTCTFRGDKISNYAVQPTPHGGVHGILEQLGAPTHA